MKKSLTICACGMLAVCLSCEKELDIRYHDIDPLTVIEGSLTPDGVEVAITLTTPMDEPMARTRLTDADVTLHDISAGAVYPLLPDASGCYTGDVRGVVGHDYRLVVERDGQHYEAQSTMYPPTVITGLEFGWIRMPYDHVAVLQVRFTDGAAASGDCYWVRLYRNGAIYRWSEVDDRSASDGICTFLTMTTRMDTSEEEDDTVLYDGDVITCTVSRISRGMHDYLEALQNDSNGPAMFSGDMCLGYFMASSPVSASVEFHPDRIPAYE